MNVSQCRLALTRACDTRSGSFGSLPLFTEKLPYLHPRVRDLYHVDPVTCAAFAAWAPARPGPRARRKRRSAPRLLRRASTKREAGAPSMAQGTLMALNAQQRSKVGRRSAKSPRRAWRTTWPRWSALAPIRLEAWLELEEVFASADARASKKDPLHSRRPEGRFELP